MQLFTETFLPVYQGRGDWQTQSMYDFTVKSRTDLNNFSPHAENMSNPASKLQTHLPTRDLKNITISLYILPLKQ
jgi:uncharacterized protein YfdQ (DUF2303 family)